jgi:hypothetical protein
MGMQNISVSEPIEDSMDVDLQPSSSGLETTDPFGEMDGTVQTDNIQEAVRQVEAEHYPPIDMPELETTPDDDDETDNPGLVISDLIRSAVHLAEEMANALEKADILASAAYEDHRVMIIKAQIASNAATVAVNLAEVAKVAADSLPTSASRNAAVQAVQAAKDAIATAASAAVARGVTEDLFKAFDTDKDDMERKAREAAIAALLAIQQNTAIPDVIDESENDAVVDGGADDILGDGDECEEGEIIEKEPDARFTAPTIPAAQAALKDIALLLCPKRKNGPGHIDPGLNPLTQRRLEWMKAFLWAYVDSEHGKEWIDASLHTARTFQKGPYLARNLREWSRLYINNRKEIPANPYRSWNTSLLFRHEDLSTEIKMHLQSIGKYIRAQDIVDYLDRPTVKERLKLKKTISLATAQRWMHKMGYRWTKQPSGQFVDGHERDDVVAYRQNIFLPAMAELDPKMRAWKNGVEEEEKPWPNDIEDGTRPFQELTVMWHHDESTFYANDRRQVRWVHEDEKAVPRAKGEGASLMVSDFVSADYGWLRAPDRSEEARVLFKAGKGREGYFTCEDILVQVRKAMGILEKHFPNEKHCLVYDNATTHLKRADDALLLDICLRIPQRKGKTGESRHRY